MGDIIDGSSRAAQSAQSTPKTGFLRRLLSSPKTTTLPEIAAPAQVAEEGLSKLKTMRVEDVAIPRSDIVCVPSDMELDALIDEFRDSGYSRLPVFEDTLDNPIGMVHLKDIALKHGFNGKPKTFKVTDQVRPVLFVPPSMPLDVLLQKMQAERTHMALVVDEYGGCRWIGHYRGFG